MSQSMKAKLVVAGVALAAFAVVSFVQRNVMVVPVIGGYLPK